MTLSIQHLTATYHTHLILKEINLELNKGQVIVLIGPNGSGKSTLLKCLAQQMPHYKGDILWNNQSLKQLSRRQLAKQVALLPQHVTAPVGMSVEQLIRFGRFPHQGWLKQWHKKDQQAVDLALEYTHLSDLRNKALSDLSGGQRQRAWIAMVLAQETPLILLDEPISMLDIGHQADILNMVRALAKQGKTVVMVLHDLATAARCADDLIAMKDGHILAHGQPKHILDAALVKSLYDLDVDIHHTPSSRMIGQQHLVIVPQHFGDPTL